MAIGYIKDLYSTNWIEKSIPKGMKSTTMRDTRECLLLIREHDGAAQIERSL